MDRRNRVMLAGQLAARDALRYTPAGVAMVRFTVGHASRQLEAGAERDVQMELDCVAVEDQAKAIAAAPLGIGVQIAGFLAPRARSSRQAILHVTEIEFAEGATHAPTQERQR